MKVRLIRIGDSRGVRIPARLLKSISAGDDANVEMNIEVRGNSIVLTPTSSATSCARSCAPSCAPSCAASARQGWSAAFRAAGASQKDDLCLTGSLASGFDECEWTW